MSLGYIAEHLEGMLEHFVDAVFFGLLPVSILGLLVGLVITIKLGEGNKSDKLIVYAFSFIGAASGIMIGSSRSGVVHVFLPALLTFSSTFMVYLYASHDRSKNKTEDVKTSQYANVEFIPYCIIALVISSVTLSFYGSSLRHAYDQKKLDDKKYMMEVEKIEIPLEYERLKKQLDKM